LSGQIFKIAAKPMPSISESLLEICARPVGAHERARAALHLLDWIGCALAGRAEPVGRAARVEAGCDPFALAGSGVPAGALALGGLGSLLEMDDVHKAALLHPGPVVAAVVAALPGADPLGALVRGYEAMIRLGAAVGPGHYARFHNTSTCGGIGAAVAAADLMGLAPEQAVWAVGHAMSMAGGVWQCRNEPVETKHLHVAEAARRGVQAARYAAQGLAGPRFVLEGPQGFLAAMAPGADPAAVIAPAGGWKINEVSFKPWPACRHTHPAIDAALILRERLGGAIPAAVRVETFSDALTFCDRPEPRTAPEARFSLQHSVAVALTEGPPPVDAFAPAALGRHAALRARISVLRDGAMTAAYPARFGAAVHVTLADGRSDSAAVADAWGDPEWPMDAAAVRAKFDRLALGAGVTPDRAATVANAVADLPRSAEGGALAAALRSLATP
jgi:2-methylcitrate dehydratase PrpD